MAGFGYELVERVEEVGETAIRPGAVDIFRQVPSGHSASNYRAAPSRPFGISIRAINSPCPMLLL
jgi:hypothetical protein